MNNLENSDKVYWHKYINFYEDLLPTEARTILEIGVFKGNSIRYWRDKYPNSIIYGLDIIDALPSWPKDEKIEYFKADQSDVAAFHLILKSIKNIDILIEDGSHDPLHQKISLMESLEYLSKGSVYILEDIHTSHPNHSYYKNRVKKFNASKSFFSKKSSGIFMSLQCLLLIEHLKSNNKIPSDIKNKIDYKNSLFSYDEIETLFYKIQSIKFYRRNVLPDYCYSCKTNDFDYINLRCNCGTSLYLDQDSMSVVLKF
jgi:hypothetical protein